ncbi:MAG TPA: response regulator [Kofleriaceae bacterium]|nr:response regulator [Kofleriaceae bacterium]
MNVLVVDGHTDERRAIVEALSRVPGVSVQCAMSDLETAAGVLARYTPDILVTGTELADADGIQLVEKVRRRGMSIVVVGPTSSRDVWLRYLAAGADRFVESDHELAELQDVVRGLVRQLRSTCPESPVRVGRVATGLVHDFYSYLHALEVVLELLERAPSDKHLWGEARAALEQAVSLMSMLMGHVRDDQARAPAPVALGEVVRAAVTAAQSLTAPRLELSVEIAGELPPVLGVAGELERMVLELVLNASEGTRNGGEVRVAVTRTADAVLVAVTSVGVDPCVPRSGLDLGMARAIVERHSGTFLVASCEPASSSVLVTLPASGALELAR